MTEKMRLELAFEAIARFEELEEAIAQTIADLPPPFRDRVTGFAVPLRNWSAAITRLVTMTTGPLGDAVEFGGIADASAQ